jgi:hypothetical protein
VRRCAHGCDRIADLCLRQAGAIEDFPFGEISVSRIATSLLLLIKYLPNEPIAPLVILRS